MRATAAIYPAGAKSITRGKITPTHLDVFDWVREPEPTPAGVIHPHPFLAPVAGSGRHDRGSEMVSQAWKRLLTKGTAVTWLYKRNGLISANTIPPLDRKPPSAPPFPSRANV